MSAAIGFRWRYRGATPSPEEFHRNLWQSVLAQFIVQENISDHPIGQVVAFDASHRDGWVHIAALSDPGLEASGLIIEGIGLLIDYLFLNWNFQKIYFSSIEFNLDLVVSGSGWLFREEGRLHRHCFYAGRYWDMVLCAIFREDWKGTCRTNLRRAVADRLSGRTRPRHAELVASVEIPALDLDQFVQLLGEELQIPEDSIHPDHRLAEDLSFDSLSTLIALDMICELVGLDDLPAIATGTMPKTVRDLFLLYCTVAQSPQEPAR